MAGDPGLPSSPLNLAYAVGRLNVHTAFGPKLARQPMPAAEELARTLRASAEQLDPGFMSAVVGGTAREIGARDAELTTRMAQAAEDVGQLLQTTDLPQSLVDLVARRVETTDVDGASTDEQTDPLLVVAFVFGVLFIVGWVVLLVRWCKRKRK